MRVGLVLAALVLGAPATAQADEAARVRAAVAALPLLGEVADGPTPVIVRGTVTGRRAREMVALARTVVADVDRRFLAARPARAEPVTLCLAATNADYAALVAAFADVPSELGFYRPDLRVAVANLARGAGNLRHELVHPLIGDDFPDVPAWLNEGLGSLYGTARLARGRLEPLVNYRLLDLQRAIASGTLPTLDELVASTHRDVRGERASTFYAMGRYVLLFLHQRGRLDATYAALRDAAGNIRVQQRILRAELDDATFVRWARRLRYRR